MEVRSLYIDDAAARMELATCGVGPGSLVVWDVGTTSTHASQPELWPCLVVHVCVEPGVVPGIYLPTVRVLTARGGLRRFNARHVRLP